MKYVKKINVMEFQNPNYYNIITSISARLRLSSVEYFVASGMLRLQTDILTQFKFKFSGLLHVYTNRNAFPVDSI